MDPTRALCEVTGSASFPEAVYPVPLRLPQDSPVPSLSLSKGTDFETIWVDKERYQYLTSLKDQFTGSGFTEARDATNPFENLGNSIFINRAAIKLSNIDAVYNLTQHRGGYPVFQTGGRFTFCDIAAGPGSFTQYIQWRRPEARGFGITLRGDLDWNPQVIDTTRFIAYYGPDNTGDLYINWRPFSDTVLTQYSEGVDLVTADGGFDVSQGQYHLQEALSSRLLLVECLTALKVLATGGNFVCKVFDTVTRISAETLYLMALCFEEVILFKPVSSRPANAERYLVCRQRRAHVNSIIDLMTKAADAYLSLGPDQSLVGFLSPLPESFTKQWLTGENNLSVERQINTAEAILQVMRGEIPPPGPLYDLHRCFILWNLPDNVLKRKSIKRDTRRR